jgi:non-specific serine/threonine protein kinase
VLSPEQILARLSKRFELLSAARDADPRQRTLRSTIEWSYELLDARERDLFARLAVFTGGCTVEAAEEVCEADLDTLGALVDKSLVRRSGERFWMFETIREYAAERRGESGEAEALTRRHASFYERFAAEAEQGMRGSSVGSWFESVEQELPNLRSAIGFSLDHREPAVALRMSTGLERFWVARSSTEGQAWLERALATGCGTAAERGRGSLLAALLAFFHGDVEQAMTRLRDATELARSAGEDGTLVAALGFRGRVLAARGDHVGALAMLGQCRKLVPGLADPWARANALLAVATILTVTGELEQGDALEREALAIMRELGDELWVATILNRSGYRAMLRGSYDEARISLEESLAIARRLRSTSLIMLALGNLGLIAVFESRYADALTLLDESLPLCNTTGNRACGAEAILGLAAAHAALGHLELAVKLDAISKAVSDATSIVYPAVRDRLEPHLRKAREQSDPASAQAHTEQRRPRPLTMDTAIAELQRHAEASARSAPANSAT